MEFSCESFFDYTYGDEALEAFHPIKVLENAITRLINFIQKTLNRIRGLRKTYLPTIHASEYNKIASAFSSGNKEINIIIKEKPINITHIEQLENATKMIEESQSFGNFVNMDASTFGKDDYTVIETKNIILALNQALDIVTHYKTEINKHPEDDMKDVKRAANAIMKFYNLQVSFFNRVLKFHPPLRDPKNVNKLGGVGTATPQAG